MSILVIATWIALGALVAALAISLLSIIVLLRKIRETAGLILFGVRAIAHQAAPIGDIVGDINRDLTEVRNSFAGLLEQAGAPLEGEELEVNRTQDRPGPERLVKEG
jgi:hypothetical protein